MAEGPPVDVGFTWGAAASWGTFLTALIGLASLVMRQIGPWRKQTTDAEAQLRKEMAETIRELHLKNDRLEERMEANRKQYEAERSLDRHKINNLSQCLDTVFLMLEATPERVVEVVRKMREMRNAQLEAEAVESATLRAEAAKPKDGTA